MGLSIIFDGAEVPSHRKLLKAAGVTCFSLNFYMLYKRGLPKTKRWLVGDNFPEGSEVYLHPGDVPEESVHEVYQAYQEFMDDNRADLAGVVEFDSDPELRAQMRQEWDDDLFWAVWNHERTTESLEAMAQKFNHIGLPYATLEAVPGLSTRCHVLSGQYGTVWHALNCAKPDNLRQVPFATASTQAWIAPMRRGETIIWDGSRIHRFPAKSKEQARTRYRRVADNAGVDPDEFQQDTNYAATKVAIWSFQQYEQRMSSGLTLLSDHVKDLDDPGSAEQGSPDLDNSPQVRGTKLVVRDPTEVGPLPIMGFEQRTSLEVIDDTETLVERTHTTSQKNSLRQCNTCFVAANCPAAKPHSTCAFNIPIEVRTKDQLRDLLTTVIEMQGQRVAFARFAEETTGGGYPDPVVSAEIDRLFKIAESAKKLEENHEFARITVESETASPGTGILSALFGERVQQLQELPTPVSPDKIIRRQIEE